jgi:tRNA G37 N-methylase Trm5
MVNLKYQSSNRHGSLIHRLARRRMDTDGQSSQRRRRNDFTNAKNQCLGKSDKSSAGRWDDGAVEICALINAWAAGYTTSSCAGRCFLYQGLGVKSTDTFKRFRVSHHGIVDAERYFDLTTISSDPTGGGDELRSVVVVEQQQQQQPPPVLDPNSSVWLRYEPFILHVACRSLSVAHRLMDAARPTFKNVGLTTWNAHTQKYLVAIWGDEGLDMPITDQEGQRLLFDPKWLQELVAQRHLRNRDKVQRFTDAMLRLDVSEMDDDHDDHDDDSDSDPRHFPDETKAPRSYDVIGDVALFHTTADSLGTDQAESILRQNRAIKVVAVRDSNLQGSERAPGTLRIVAGTDRRPLITTHKEYGIQCIVDLEQTFFSVRMNRERQRICQSIQAGESVLVLFTGVGMDALQIAGNTMAGKVTAIESNAVAVNCARRSLLRNKVVKEKGNLEIIEGDVLVVLPTLPVFDRILAPRPKQGTTDGQQTGDTDDTLAGGAMFLAVVLRHLNRQGGICHWYDFCADFEFPEVPRARRLLRTEAEAAGLHVDIISVVKAGSIAMRQFRVCIDFRVSELTNRLPLFQIVEQTTQRTGDP